MKSVVMIGPAIESFGGVQSVVATYRQMGLFTRWSVIYLSTFRRPGWISKVSSVLICLAQLSALLLRRQVALVHVHTASRGSFWRKLLFIIAARAGRVPVVLHVHSGEFIRFYMNDCGHLRQSVIRWTMRSSARVLCLTELWRSQLAMVEPSARLTVLANPVTDEPGVRAARASGSVQPGCVLFLGRLNEKKGVFDLLRAWPAVRALVPEARLVLAGNGDVRPLLELASQLGVRETLVLPGWITGAGKREWLARADIFVLPSHAEGLPVSVLEAMICGIPVVATDVGGIPEVVADGAEGVLVPQSDPRALANALSGLLQDGTRRESVATAALARAKRDFAAAPVLAALEEVWRETATGYEPS